MWGLFGLNTIPEDARIVVITEGEYDAMAVHQATGLPAVSLPNGAAHLPFDVLPWLDRFERVYLWLDADLRGREAAESFAHKIGLEKTFIIDSRRGDPLGPKDANDALLRGNTGKPLRDYVLDSQPLGQNFLKTVADYGSEIANRIINAEENKGMQSRSFGWFNKRLKGFRRGEFTILTGPTGSGKTTLLAQLSLDFLESGVPTLWASLEV